MDFRAAGGRGGEIPPFLQEAFQERAAEIWKGNLDREGAEKALSRAPRGTFFFRPVDPLLLPMVRSLEIANRLTIRPYVFSYVSREGEVKERLVLETERGWTVYEDQPNLGSFSPKVQELLFKDLP